MKLDEGLLTALCDLIEEAGDIHSQYCGLANAAAFLAVNTPDINWLGFYVTVEDGAVGDASSQGRYLILGPFSGLPACTRITWGKGVCGTAVSQDIVQRVADVHAFAGHIACDPASRSELVIPLHDAKGVVVGVLDIDSPVPDRFSPDDEIFFSAAARIIERKLFSW
ncbi:GAF domain-containing protein [Parasphaerochaeta coccoides]|nr:GAF domain-containing protein [Parasphaerochaeta coccoides]